VPDFGQPKELLWKGGLQLQMLKCPNCGASVEFPESGSATKCRYCGSTIYTQSLLDRLRSILAGT
jgi:ribosomal protein S27AE